MKKSNKLKKLIALGLVGIISIGLVGCGQKESKEKAADQTLLTKIKSDGKFVVGTAPGFPPFEFLQSKDGKSEVIGSDIDLAQKLADKMGVKLEVVSMDFDALIPALKAKKIDAIIAGMTPTEKRKQQVDFSDVYYKGTNSIIVNKNFNGQLKTEEDLKNLKVGVQKGSTQEIFAIENLKAKEVKSLPSITDLILDLKNNNIQAIILSTTVGKINVQKFDGIKLEENVDLKGYKSDEDSAIAIDKGNNKDFLELVNKEIKDLTDSGEYEKIMNKNIELSIKAEK